MSERFTTIRVTIPSRTPLRLLRDFANSIGCDLRLMPDGSYGMIPRDARVRFWRVHIEPGAWTDVMAATAAEAADIAARRLGYRDYADMQRARGWSKDEGLDVEELTS